MKTDPCFDDLVKKKKKKNPSNQQISEVPLPGAVDPRRTWFYK